MTGTLIDGKRRAGPKEEQRRPRSRLLNVTAESPGLDFTLLELSPIGMSIETTSRLSVGEVRTFILRHKHGMIRLEGEVRWSRLHLTSETAEDGSPSRYRAGFELSGEGLLAQPPVAEEEKIEAIREILEKKTLGVVFQPIYSLKEGTVFAYEALARSPIAELTSLPELYEVAALAGLVGELGRQHRAQAVAEAPDLPLFLNVNPHEFDYGWLVQPDDPIFQHDHQVFIEVTENVSVSRFRQCLNVLEELRGKGIRVAIDDLGAGFSNLRYLNELAPDFVKVDRSLIAGLRDATRQFRLLESIVAMCHNLGSKVIAEGVEHADELVAIDHAGIQYCQGYLLGRPELPAPSGSWPAFR